MAMSGLAEITKAPTDLAEKATGYFILVSATSSYHRNVIQETPHIPKVLFFCGKQNLLALALCGREKK
jgi:hypothetical protein